MLKKSRVWLIIDRDLNMQDWDDYYVNNNNIAIAFIKRYSKKANEVSKLSIIEAPLKKTSIEFTIRFP